MGRHLFSFLGIIACAHVLCGAVAAQAQGPDLLSNQAVENSREAEGTALEEGLELKPERDIFLGAQEGTPGPVSQEEDIQKVPAVLVPQGAETQTRTFELRYKTEQEIAETVRGHLTENVGRLEPGARPRTLTVTDTPEKLQELSSLIQGLDHPPQEVFVDVRTIQVVLNDENQKGIDWEAILSDYKAIDYHEGRMSVGTVTEEDLAVLLEALDTVGAINTVAANKVLAAENQKIDIVIKADDLLSARENEKKDVGSEAVRYEATPWLTDNGDLAVRVMPLVVGEGEPNTKGEILTVAAGTTIVVGGLFQKVTVEAVNKIPFLGDLPLLGFAFRRHGQRFRETEVITFLTPRVVVPEADDEGH